MSEKDERPKHTLSGDSEPSMPEPGQMHMKLLVLENGEPAMLIMIPLKDRVVHFTTIGTDLETFYLRLRVFMEGKGKRPQYLG